MKTVPLLFLLQLLSLPCLKGGEFCALRLSVTLPDGIPVVSAAAELLDARGTIVQTTTIANGEGHFCDFGFGPHSIRVHEESSIPTVLTGIQLIYGEPTSMGRQMQVWGVRANAPDFRPRRPRRASPIPRPGRTPSIWRPGRSRSSTA